MTGLATLAELFFSNAAQEIQDFDSREAIRLLESIDFETAIFYIPSKIQDQFVELVNQQITNQWEEDNNVNVSIGDIGLIGNDQLSQFFKKMLLKKVVKPKGYETSEHEQGVHENTGDDTLNAVDNIVDKIAKAIEVGTQNQTKIMWKKSVFLTLLVVIVVIITPIFFSRMTTQPPFHEFHELKTENAQFQKEVEQKNELLQERENKLQELTIENDNKKTENLNLQKKVEIRQEKITQFQKEVEEKQELLQERENKLQALTIENDKKKIENLSFQRQVEIRQEKITQFQKEVEEKQELLQECENKLQALTIENDKKKTENMSFQRQVKIKQNKIRLFQKEVEQKEGLLQKTKNKLRGLTIASRTGQIQDLQKQLKKAQEEIEFRKKIPTPLEQFLLQLESGDRIVIVLTLPSKEKVQKQIKLFKSQYPELFWVQKGTPLHNQFGDGIYKEGNEWLGYIGGYYSSKSAQILVKKAKKELGMRHDTYHKNLPKKYLK